MIHASESEREIIEDILRLHVPNCEVRVFGSRYKGTHKPYSDIDMAIVGKELLDIHKMGELKDAFEESDLPYRADVMDWNAISPAFQSTIMLGGYETIQPATIQ
ncbi:MAG: nucleotidyltransferase domain-containing protein [Acidobacteriota bacterium]|jgi:predicted nucleotidyltransferase|nr:nucleotidyltransferase domain-containing protein [Acidobacteriota bacterium]